MTNIPAYPEREHVDPVKNFYDVMRFEMSIHPDGPEFRRGLGTISQLYKKFPLSRSLYQYSRLMAVTHSMAGYSQYDRGIDKDFHRGSVLASHSILRSQTVKNRGMLLLNDVFAEHLTDDESYYFPIEDLESMVNGLTLWSQGGFMDSLSGETDEFQELVISAAIRAYDDVPNAGANEDSFISGFMFAKDMMVLSLKDSNKVGFTNGYILTDPPA